MPDSLNPSSTNHYIEDELLRRLKALEDCCDADVLLCIAPIVSPLDDIIRRVIEGISNRRKNLLVILETPGGSIEVTERIANVLRHNYGGEVSFLAPNLAMSAGTILVMSGDRILMDYYSVLGPIDPQIPSPTGDMVPGLGYIEKFEQLVEKSSKGQLSQAELAFLIEKFDPAKLHWLEQAREHGVDLLKKWLVQYKLKDWTVTETNQTPVTADMKETRAKEIAEKLNNTKLWRSHSRGISISEIRGILNLKVEDFGADPNLAQLRQHLVDYYQMKKDYMSRRGWQIAIETRNGPFEIN